MAHGQEIVREEVSILVTSVKLLPVNISMKTFHENLLQVVTFCFYLIDVALAMTNTGLPYGCYEKMSKSR